MIQQQRECDGRICEIKKEAVCGQKAEKAKAEHRLHEKRARRITQVNQ